MLVSKAKPCKCKYESCSKNDDIAKGSLNQSWSIWSCGDESRQRWMAVEKLELIHANERRLREACIYQSARRPAGRSTSRPLRRSRALVVGRFDRGNSG